MILIGLFMELWHLKTFCVVAETGSFTGAAEQLNLSQPAVSIQIKTLEEEVGRELFSRRPDGVDLTLDGTLFLKHAKRVLTISSEVLVEIDRDQESSDKGHLVTGAITHGLENFFLWTYIEFRKTRSDISIKPKTISDADTGIKMLKYTKEIDLILTPFDPKDDQIRALPFGKVRFAVISSASHRLAKRASVMPDMLQLEKWVLFEKEDRMRLLAEEQFKKNGIAPRSIMSTNDGSVIAELLQKTNMITYIRVNALQSRIEDKTLAVLNCPEMESEVMMYFCFRNNPDDLEKVSPLLKFLARNAKEDSGASIGMNVAKEDADRILDAIRVSK